MMGLAEGLPVSLMPERERIALVRLDVVNDLRGVRLAFLQAVDAQWMIGQECYSRFLPARGLVPPLPLWPIRSAIASAPWHRL